MRVTSTIEAGVLMAERARWRFRNRAEVDAILALTALLYVLAVANLFSIMLSLLLIRGLGFGIEGSAIANVVAQTGAGLVFLWLLVRRRTPLRPSCPRRGWRRLAAWSSARAAPSFAAPK